MENGRVYEPKPVKTTTVYEVEGGEVAKQSSFDEEESEEGSAHGP